MRSVKPAVWALVVVCFIPFTARAQQVKTPEERKALEKKISNEEFNGKNLFEWVGELKNTDPSIRLKAVAAIKYYGSAAQDATPRLLERLKDKDASTRVNTIITLGIVGFNPRDKNDVIAGLTTALNDREGIVRYQAVTALSGFGPSANSAVGRLVALSKDSITWEIRAAACTALAMTGLRELVGIDPAAWTALLSALHDPTFEVRKAALQALLYMGKPAQPGDVIIENRALTPLFSDRHEVLAIWARLCYMRLNGGSEIQYTAIAKHLHSSNPDARSEACRAFAIIGVDAKSKTKEIINHIDDKDPVTAIWACAAVAQMGDAGMAAIPKLKKLAESTDDKLDDGVKLAARQAAERLGDKEKDPAKAGKGKAANERLRIDNRPKSDELNGKTLEQWITDLKNPDPSIKLKAIATIKAFGEPARKATPLLLRALGERDASTRVNALITLGTIGFSEKELPDAIVRIIPLLNDTQGIVRYQAASTLGKFGPAAYAAVPRLVLLSRDLMTFEIREAACMALASAGYREKEGVDPRAWGALIDVLKDHCFEVKFAGLKGLLYFGKPVAAADTAKESTILQSLFADKNEAIAIWSRLCYMKLNGVSEDHLSAIAQHMSSKQSDVRAEVCKAFAIVGLEAKSKVPDLIRSLDDKNASVVIWACAAVAQMKDAGKPALEKLKALSISHADAGARGAAKEAITRLEGDAKAEVAKEKKDAPK